MAEAVAVGERPRLGLRPGWAQDYGVYLALLVILVINLAITDNFVSTGNLRTQLIQVVPVVVVGLGMALVIGTEGIDLSVGSVMALSSAILPLYLGYGFGTAILFGLVAGVLVGLLNGWLVAVIGVQPIVATLALLVGGRGLALVLSGGQQKTIRDPNLIGFGTNELAGIPYIVLLAVVLTLLTGFVVRRTLFGRRLVAIGGNRLAAELAGLPVRRILITVYVICGLLAALAGIIATARLGASTPNNIGLNIELAAITAVVVGGTPLSGGRVRVLGTVAGALLMQLIRSTLIAHDLQDSVAQMVQAAIILIAVYAQRGRKS
jgi:ribose transport system permease protein